MNLLFTPQLSVNTSSPALGLLSSSREKRFLDSISRPFSMRSVDCRPLELCRQPNISRLPSLATPQTTLVEFSFTTGTNEFSKMAIHYPEYVSTLRTIENFVVRRILSEHQQSTVLEQCITRTTLQPYITQNHSRRNVYGLFELYTGK